jgi:hypothetical protein
MKNAITKTITIQQALSSAAVRDGFSDYAMSRGWHEKTNGKEQWNYERGRMFAAWLKSKAFHLASYPLKRGRWASPTTISHYRDAMREGSIF